MTRRSTRRDGSIMLTSLAMLLATAAPVVAQDGSEPEAITSLGADREAFNDGFDVPGAWGVVDDKSTRIVYEDSALVVTLKQDANGRTTTRRPAQASPTMRLEVDVELGADGSSAGPMCGSRAASDFAFGVVNSADDWFLGRMSGDAGSILASGHLEGTDITLGSPVHLAIECATTDTGARVAMWVAGQLVADVTGDGPSGPFDRVGIYADAVSGGSTVRFDDAVASDGGPVPGLLTLGADRDAARDDFSLPGTWATLDDEATRIAYEDGALAFTLKEDGSGRWTVWPAPHASNEMRLELDVELGGDHSSAGPMCLTAGDSPDVAFGVVDAADDWTIGRFIDGTAATIARGHLADVDLDPGTPFSMALECANTDEGDRMALWIEGRLVADVTSEQQHRPYDKAGAYADAVTGGTTTRFDDALLLTGVPVSILTSLGADLVLLEDSFTDTSVWGTGKARQGSVRYDKGKLRFAMRTPGGSLWTWRVFPETMPALRVEGAIQLGDGQGDAGFLCGAPGDDPPFYFAGLSSGAEVVIGSAADSILTEIERVPLPDGVAPSASHRLGLECAVTGTGSDRLAVWVDGVPAIDHLTTGSLGAFDRAALYADADSRRFAASFDDVVLMAGSEYRPVGDAPPVATEGGDGGE